MLESGTIHRKVIQDEGQHQEVGEDLVLHARREGEGHLASSSFTQFLFCECGQKLLLHDLWRVNTCRCQTYRGGGGEGGGEGTEEREKDERGGEEGREGREKDERRGGGRRSNITFRFREGHVSSLGPRPRQADEILE